MESGSGMGGNLVNLNVNPCKMCMPMGAVSALCGLRGCMAILHGSQGCATYIRRHAATHYNEPIDIASSSLTEEGTVFGGEANLLKGLRNMLDLYAPEVIGVCTTCLAETIGEDVGAIIKKFFAQNPGESVKIINVASPGYGGTQNEGWFAALRAVLEQVEPNAAPNGKINVVTPMISPADTRSLKRLFAELGVEYVLLPDISDNLDGATEKRYNRLKTEGTPIADVAAMAGGRLTIEFSEFTGAQNSPAEYLKAAHGVPFVKLPLPVGIRGIDKLISVLEDAGGRVSSDTMKARGRCLDAMADSHKHCAEARAAVYGDPDFVAALVRLCCENGILPVVAATGSVSRELRDMLARETAECAKYHFEDSITVLDDCDFAAIENACRERGANLLIGSSDGRRISRSMNIPLLRCAFPIHDYTGGQRVRILGFEGTLNVLDMAANAMIEKTESTFRASLYGKFYMPVGGADMNAVNTDTVSTNVVVGNVVNENVVKAFSVGGDIAGAVINDTVAKTAAHPCFGEHACQNARVHLPVAPECNIQCNYCLRNYDCMNESRPGVASKILSPAEAFERYVRLKETMPILVVAGVAGPGDALANFDLLAETLRLIREYDRRVTFCIATNGLLLPQYVSRLRELGVSHVTVTVNAVEPAIGAKIYRHVCYMGKIYTGAEGAAFLLANQLAGIKMLADAGIICKVNCVTLKGINDGHIPDVVKTVAELGAFMTNIMPHIPVKGSAFEGLDRVTNREIAALRERCGAYVKQMSHCRQCRSDAAGTLDDDRSLEFYGGEPALENSGRMRFAVATKSGAVVDLHFGHASEFYIYESDATATRFVETRKVGKYCGGPECGDREDRWEPIIRAVADCEAVLAMRIGPTPEKRLKENGIDAIMTYERVETAVARAAKERSVAYGIA
jgi:nitrogenase molybdenum-iron protein alpha/beta subunit/MoaA/NifB/PqqE/SkfB family radical SAM enzyme